jgi:hypothetical protein
MERWHHGDWWGRVELGYRDVDPDKHVVFCRAMRNNHLNPVTQSGMFRPTHVRVEWILRADPADPRR